MSMSLNGAPSSTRGPDVIDVILVVDDILDNMVEVKVNQLPLLELWQVK